MSDFDAAARAAKGCALLDEKVETGWAKKIQIERLNPNKFGDCMVTQVFGDFDKGLIELGIDIISSDSYDAAVPFGFHPTIVPEDTDPDQADAELDLEGEALREAFIAEVNKRLAA